MITILGASGFIGSNLVARLKSEKISYFAPSKEDNLQGKDLGKIIYCIGLTADFRKYPLNTVDAHVCKLLDILRNTKFESILYLSSTRIYGANDSTQEKNKFYVDPLNLSDLYNLSKLMGEALLYASGYQFSVARLSNVFGGDLTSDNFLSDVIRQAVEKKHIIFNTSFESEKDYINIKDVVDLLLKITLNGKEKIYNVASGINTSNRQIADKLVNITKCTVEVTPQSTAIKFPVIDIKNICHEFEYQPSELLEDMERLVKLYQNKNGDK